MAVSKLGIEGVRVVKVIKQKCIFRRKSGGMGNYKLYALPKGVKCLKIFLIVFIYIWRNFTLLYELHGYF